MTIHVVSEAGMCKHDAPVFGTSFVYDWGGRRWPYPDVWVSEPVDGAAPASAERRLVCHYTPDSDPTGSEALRFGDSYYYEGLQYCEDEQQALRIGCFQVAELLFLHAAAAGDPAGHLGLARLYLHDRCEGGYWEIMMSWQTARDLRRPCSCEEKAFRHYRIAARADVAEACCALGDLLREGRGCQADLAEAFAWYSHAYTLGASGGREVRGCAALRFGRAYEQGEGCDRNLTRAEAWYGRAFAELDAAVSAGAVWLRTTLWSARVGLVRVRRALERRN